MPHWKPVFVALLDVIVVLVVRHGVIVFHVCACDTVVGWERNSNASGDGNARCCPVPSQRPGHGLRRPEDIAKMEHVRGILHPGTPVGRTSVYFALFLSCFVLGCDTPGLSEHRTISIHWVGWVTACAGW